MVFRDNAFCTNRFKRYRNKSYTFRKNEFDKRIINTLHPNEESDKEIKRIRWEYERIDNNVIDRHSAIYYFRKRLNGYLLNFPSKQDELFGFSARVLPMIEAEHAYQYYKYLVELKKKDRTGLMN